jgi:23S rRNA (uracil1939-C5)-methyltransferase
MRLKIESFAGGGRGVARAGGRVWFVAGALPGEEVDAELETERAGVIEARTRAVVRPVPMREKEPCPVAGACGGCDLAHVRRERAPEALRAILAGALRHAPRELADAVGQAPVVASPMQWRLRARLHWDPAAGVLGFFGPRSFQVVDIAPCRVVTPRLAAALPALRAALARRQAPAVEVDWLEDLAGERAIAGWRGAGAAPRGPVVVIAGWHPLSQEGALRRGGWGKQEVVMQLPIPLRVPLGAFFQGNRHLVPRLFARVSEIARALRPAAVVDLYGGVGLLAAAARDGGVERLAVVEAHRGAARAAALNLPGAAVHAADAEEFLASPPTGSATLAIVDPPRAGMSAQARRRLGQWRPAAILWLSCDPSTFGRDAAELLAEHYRLELLEVWDLFAGSHHAEILALFRRAKL